MSYQTLGMARINYQDFDIAIGLRKRKNQYPVKVILSPAGQADGILSFPFKDTELQERLNDLQAALLRSNNINRRLLSQEEQTVQRFGQDLFNALFKEDVKIRYEISKQQVSQLGMGLRIKLRISPPNLANLPWEFMYDANQSEFVCLSRSTPITRYLELPQPIMPLTVNLPLRILIMIASPDDSTPLDIEREKYILQKAFKDLEAKGLVTIRLLPSGTWRQLLEASWEDSWHIFHFIGHGGFNTKQDEGFIILEDDNGESLPLPANQLASLLADHTTTRLVILNTCEGARGSEYDSFSSSAAILARKGIPAILAMQNEITDEAAIEFTSTFYRALATGMPVDAAVTEARKAIHIQLLHRFEWGTPVLHMRSPNGVLFELPQKPFIQSTLQPLHTTNGNNVANENIVISNNAPINPSYPVNRSFVVKQTQRGSLSFVYRPHYAGVTSIIWSPNGNYIATGSHDHSVQVWDIRTEDCLITYKGHSNTISALAWSPNGRHIASASRDRSVHVWGISTRKNTLIYKQHSDWVLDVTWSPNSAQIASASHDHTLRIWSAFNGNTIFTRFCLNGVKTVEWVPDNTSLVTVGYEHTIQRWNTLTGNNIFTDNNLLDGSIAAWSPNGKHIAFGTLDRKIQVWNIAMMQISTQLSAYRHHAEAITCIDWSPDNKYIASASKDGAIHIWSISSGRKCYIYEGHSKSVRVLAWSPDSKCIASVDDDQIVQIWQMG